ncbi:hypothetical protein COCC4DRAFT_147682, partial [Bipolaris maydis ATCC 48331]
VTPTIHWSLMHYLTRRPPFVPITMQGHAQSPTQSPCLAISKETRTSLIYSHYLL